MKINWKLSDSGLYEAENIAFGYSQELLKHIKDELCFLEAHNKNLTSKQYYSICTLKSIFENIEEA